MHVAYSRAVSTLLSALLSTVSVYAADNSPANLEPLNIAEKQALDFLPVLRKERRENVGLGRIQWGGQLKAFPFSRFNRDLTGESSFDQADIPVRVEFGLAAPLTRNSDLYFSVELKEKVGLKDSGGARSEVILENARVNIHDAGMEGLSLRFGRMTIQDKREAILRAQYDGALMSYASQSYQLDFGIFSRGDLRADILHGDASTRSTDIITKAEKRLFGTVNIGALILLLNDRSLTADDRTYYALRSYGRTLPQLQHWLEVTHLRGETLQGSRSAWSTEIRAIYDLALPTRTELGVAYIWGSGDSDPTDEIDGLYRQTGLQRNNSFWGAGPKYRLLGEALRAEVANIHAVTLMARHFPGKAWSVSLLYHLFWQDKLATSQPGWSWNGQPNGLNKKLASEIDVTVGVKLAFGLSLEANVAYVNPGAAFGGDRSDGFAIGMEMRFAI